MNIKVNVAENRRKGVLDLVAPSLPIKNPMNSRLQMVAKSMKL
jgi:hypothetical protein